jgi:hypothetical protein|tara:strand:- start:2692 stop:3060 length:369 start_codon:yes stop_codon:yes gene_type:complete
MDRYVCVKDHWNASLATYFRQGDTYRGPKEHLPRNKDREIVFFELFSVDAPEEVSKEERDSVVSRLKQRGYKGKISPKWPIERLLKIDQRLDKEDLEAAKKAETKGKQASFRKDKDKVDGDE